MVKTHQPVPDDIYEQIDEMNDTKQRRYDDDRDSAVPVCRSDPEETSKCGVGRYELDCAEYATYRDG